MDKVEIKHNIIKNKIIELLTKYNDICKKSKQLVFFSSLIISEGIFNIYNLENKQILIENEITDVQYKNQLRLCEVIENVITGKMMNVTKYKNDCLNSLYCALYSLLYFNNFKSAIDFVICLGGATGINASISGVLLGAFYGYENIIMDDITAKNIDKIMKINNNIFNENFEIMITQAINYLKYKFLAI
jgi:ADP-ribosylglycohydrolase